MKQGNGKEMNADQNKWKKFPIMEINGLNKQRFQTFKTDYNELRLKNHQCCK